MNSTMSLIVPLIALFANVFLFLTALGTKKDKVIYSFMLLLTSFALWCTGSLLMRLEVYPGIRFWFEVSSFGIFFLQMLNRAGPVPLLVQLRIMGKAVLDGAPDDGQRYYLPVAFRNQLAVDCPWLIL